MAESIMNFNLSTTDMIMFNSNLKNQLQYTSKLAGIFPSQPCKGSLAQVTTIIGKATAYVRNTPNSDTLLSETSYNARWVSGEMTTIATLVDNLDTLQTMIEPTSAIVNNFALEFGRVRDDYIINGLVGTAITGIKGTERTAFNSKNIVPFDLGTGVKGASQGGTIEKLRLAKKQLIANYVDTGSDFVFICHNAFYYDLYNYVQVTQNIYSGAYTMVNDTLERFLGFRIINVNDRVPTRTATTELVEGIPNTNGVVAQNIATVTDAAVYGVWEDMYVRLDNRPDKNNAKQIFAEMMAGATRIYEDKVVIVESAVI